jgi:hypothetical protein
MKRFVVIVLGFSLGFSDHQKMKRFVVVMDVLRFSLSQVQPQTTKDASSNVRFNHHPPPHKKMKGKSI